LEKFRAGSLLDRGPLSLREREIVIDRTCALTGCEYEWGVHVATFADAAHLTAEQVRATVLDGADDEAKIFEVILLCGFYRTVSYLANALDLPLEEKAARFPKGGSS
jgi:alkylhydroperoxidase family enzyme